MKKLLVCIALCALLLSLGTVFAAADELPPVTWTVGSYTYGDADDFEALGDVTIAWAPDFTQKMDLTDGDLSDWYAAYGETRRVVTQKNMITWLNEGDGVPADWKMSMFAVADSDYLYLAFDVVDANFAYATDAASYNGDAIQLGIDFGEKLKETLDKDSDIMPNKQDIFYSFACISDGGILKIMRQSADKDGVIPEEDKTLGAAKKNDEGWSVELALPWQMLYDDYCWKAWSEDTIYVGSDEHLPLKLGFMICYLNRDASEKDLTWAAATAVGYTNSDGAPVVSWTPYDNGGTLILPWNPDERFQINCDGVRQINVYETAYPETLPPETEPPYDPPVDYPDSEEWVETETQTAVEWYETLPPEVEETLRDAAEDLDAEDELNAILEKYGCTAVVGMGSLTVLVTVAAAAYVIRKKK